MKRVILYLAVLTLLALLALALFAPRKPAGGETATAVALLPEIAARINDVDRVEIISANSTTVATLVRTSDAWQLKEMGGYRADWSKLQALLADLAQARVIEQKTANPEYYTRLGVEDVSAADAAGVLVVLGLEGQATGIIVGNRASGRDGQYVRIQDTATSLMVDRVLDVPGDLLAWAERRIIDINAAEVAEVEVIHPQGEQVLVTKVAADDTDFVLQDLPPGREIKSNWAVNSLGSVLSLLDMESVRPAQDVDWSDAVRMRLLLFSGVEIMADMVTAGEDRLIRLQAGYPAGDVVGHDANDEPPADETLADASDAAAADTTGTDRSGHDAPGAAGAASIEQKAAADAAQIVADINSRTSGWAYGITAYKFDAMVKKPEDLLKPVEAE